MGIINKKKGQKDEEKEEEETKKKRWKYWQQRRRRSRWMLNDGGGGWDDIRLLKARRWVKTLIQRYGDDKIYESCTAEQTLTQCCYVYEAGRC